MSSKYLLGVAALILTLLPACDTSSPEVDGDAAAVSAVAALQADYEAGLSHALATHPDALDEASLVASSLEFYSDLYGAGTASYVAFEAGLNSVRAREAARRGADAPEALRVTARRVDAAVAASATFEAFQTALDGVRAEVLAASWSQEDTEQALAYVALLESSLEFLASNAEFVGDETARVASDWWNKWGKCAAGVVGGGIMGGLGGAAAGSVVPALGTGLGGAVGAVGGALSGAAASC